MIRFDRDKVLLLYQLVMQETGGYNGVRDLDLLDSALESAFATFDGKDLYPSKEEKAAQLGYALVANHAFVDGNKRIGIYVMLSFLAVNGIEMNADNREIVRIGMGLADGSIRYPELLDWIREHAEIS